MNQSDLFSILTDLRSKIDMQSVDNAYIKQSFNRVEMLVSQEINKLDQKISTISEGLEEKITSLSERFDIIESERKNKKYVKDAIFSPVFSRFLGYLSNAFFVSMLFCIYEGFMHIHDFKMLNFS